MRILDRAHGLVRVAAGRAELWAPDPGGLDGWAHAAIRPEGVAIERETPPQGSARNHLAARIVAMEPEGPLEPGLAVTALVKATAIRLSPAPSEVGA